MQSLTQFFQAHNIRSLWDEVSQKWWYSAIDICAALRGCNHKTARNYYNQWRYMKSANNIQSLTPTNQLKFQAADGKRYYTAAVDLPEALRLIQTVNGTRANELRLLLAEALAQDTAVSNQFAQIGELNRDHPNQEMQLQTTIIENFPN